MNDALGVGILNFWNASDGYIKTLTTNRPVWKDMDGSL